MAWSIPIFRVAGIQLRIHITFLLLIVWLAFGYYAQSGSAVAASRVIFVLLLFLCVVLHEFGHAFAAKAFGINTPDITLLPIGGVARLERMPEEPVQELIIAVAGPLVNVVIAAGVFIAGGSQGLLNSATVEGGSLIAQLLTINILLVLFNLLPAFPMDGGRVLRALLATRQDLIAALGKNDPELRVGDVMRRDIPTVTIGTRFEDAFRIMQECNCPAVPVLDRMKRLVGLLTPENVAELMMVQSAMPQRRVL